MRLERRVQVLKFEGGATLEVEELVHVTEVLLVQLVIVDQSDLPLTPSYVIGKITIHSVVSPLDLRLRGHLLCRQPRLNRGMEFCEADDTAQRLVDSEKLLLSFAHKVMVG